jgi:hypothetical protein
METKNLASATLEVRNHTGGDAGVKTKRNRPPEPPQTACLGEFIDQKRAGRLQTMPERYRGHFVAAWAATCSPRRAIKAFCLECQGFEVAAITDCTCYACPVWNFRPYQK